MTIFAAFRKGQILTKLVTFTIFSKNAESIPGINQVPMAPPNRGPLHI